MHLTYFQVKSDQLLVFQLYHKAFVIVNFDAIKANRGKLFCVKGFL